MSKLYRCQLLTASDYQTVPWRNGKGTTTQIAIYPETADFAKGNPFDFRVSMAPVIASGKFSIFEGYERVLILLNLSKKGQGITLYQGRKKYVLLWPMARCRFSGDHEKTYGELHGAPVTDFNVITKRGMAEAGVQIYHPNSFDTWIPLQADYHLIYCVSGALVARLGYDGQFHVHAGETLAIGKATAWGFPVHWSHIVLRQDVARHAEPAIGIGINVFIFP